MKDIIYNFKRRRDYFLNNNLEVCEPQIKEFITEILSPIKSAKPINQDIEDALDYCIYFNFFDKRIITFLEEVSTKKMFYDTRINVLDFIINFNRFFTKTKYIYLNQKFNSKNPIVHFQYLVNLLIYKESNILLILKILKRQNFPTLFYRLHNSISENEEIKKVILKNFNQILELIINSKTFSEEVKKELKNLYQKAINDPLLPYD